VGSDTLTDIENLTGSAFNDVLTGDANANALSGGAGNDTIDGGAGVDTLTGGIGDDAYVVDDVNDQVVELSGEGVDSVTSSVGYTLSDNVENLSLSGSANVNATGNALDNRITGNSGSNVLNGGVGVDILIGLDGDDRYIVDNSGDTATEVAGQGVDTVASSVSFTLGVALENLELTGTGAINGTGNELANLITGNGAANVLSGAAGIDTLNGGDGNDILDGGVGGDLLFGGLGDDFIYVESIDDIVTEYAGEGIDTVSSSINYALTANVENLNLTGGANGTGNGLDNFIVGNSGSNRLDGGAGNDKLIGGDGIDYFTGGAGADTFVDQINTTPKVQTKLGNLSFDYVLDFQSGVDKIDLSGIDANLGKFGDQAFTWGGSGKNAGELTFKTYASVNGAENALGIDLEDHSGPVTIVFGNVDSGKDADFALVLFSTASVSSGDFLF
jgi:Ca2+-binding RTX toxin-like protein